MSNIEIAQKRAELEELDLRRSAIQQEIDALEKENEKPVLRRAAFDKLTAQEKSDYCAQVRAGKAALID